MIVVAPLSAFTFWIAGWTAYFWLENIRRSNQEYVHNDFGLNAIVSLFLPTVILIIIGIAWLILSRAEVTQRYTIPVWTASVACVIALLILAGDPVVRLYFNACLWLSGTFLLTVYLYFWHNRRE